MSQQIESDAWRLEVPDLDDNAVRPLLVIPTVHPRGDRRVTRLAQAALDEGFRIHLIWLGEGQPVVSDFVSETIVPSPGSTIERIKLTRAVTKIATALEGDMWHIHDFYMLPFAVRWNRKTQKPVIFDSHEYYGLYYASKLPLPKFGQTLVSRLIDWYEVRSVKRFGGANLVAERMQDKYRKHSIPVSLSPNFPPLSSTDVGGVNFADRKSNVLYAGSLTPEYGSKEIINLIASSDRRQLPFRFTIAGRFPTPTHRDEFLRELDQKGVSPTAYSFLGTVPVNEIPGLMRNSGFGISLTNNHSQAHLSVHAKLFEYVAFGLVVVASDLEAQRRFLEESGVSIIVEKQDVNAVLDQMLAICDEPEKTGDLLKNAQVSAKENLDWDAVAAPNFRELLRLVSNQRTGRQN